MELVDVTTPGLAYICLGGFAVAFSMVSLLIKERLYINEVILGTGFGILMGPHVAGVFDPRDWGGGKDTNTITLEVMRVVLAIGLFAIGVELPRSYMREHARGLLVMVVPTMAFGWVVVAGIIHVLFLSLDYISSLCISACLTPTDPVVCAAFLGEKSGAKNIPLKVRRILEAESSSNDGLAFPFLSIAIYLTVDDTRREAIGHWFLVGWLYQVIMGTVIGALIGLAFSYLMKISHRKGFIDHESFVAQYIALAILTSGAVSLIGSDDLLGAFAAGSAVFWDGHFSSQTEDESFASVIDLLLNVGCFMYIGAWMPFDAFDAPELGIVPWRLVVLLIAILLVRRIPCVMLLYRYVPELDSWREALFAGHFGPMGVGAMFISALALSRLPAPRSPPGNQAELLSVTLEPIVAFIVLGSIVVHGLSMPFFSLGKTVHSHARSTLARTRTDQPGFDVVSPTSTSPRSILRPAPREFRAGCAAEQDIGEQRISGLDLAELGAGDSGHVSHTLARPSIIS